MTMETITNAYASKKVILQFPDDYVARPQFFDEQSALAVKENGRFIIKAGTPFPSNDGNATGIVLNDLDVTNGDANGAVLVRGHINTAKAEENTGVAYAPACISALKGIYFYPLGGEVADSTTIKSDTVIKGGAENPKIVVTLEGTDFAPKKASQLLTNYTITPGTSGLTAEKITRVDDKTIEIQFTGTAVASKQITIVAGANTVINGIASNTLTVNTVA